MILLSHQARCTAARVRYLRAKDAEGEEVAAGRHSWFLTEEAHMEAQVLLPAVVCCYQHKQHWCLASPEPAALQHRKPPQQQTHKL